MYHKELARVIEQELNCQAFEDYAPNGLQVEGRPTVRRIVTGVTACQALLDYAVEQQADAVIVHHGYFWNNESPTVVGMKRQRLKTLLANEINLYAYHLPLDAHPILGNNAQLADQLGIESFGAYPNIPYLFHGELFRSYSALELTEHITQVLGRVPLHCGGNETDTIQTLAWCTGGGQNYIEKAVEYGVDAFITGEVSEKTVHVAREMGIHFFAAGHHATERYGIQALTQWLIEKHDLDVTFIDIENPV